MPTNQPFEINPDALGEMHAALEAVRQHLFKSLSYVHDRRTAELLDVVSAALGKAQPVDKQAQDQ